ncbi:MAG: RhuM family protein [Desulfatiglans sp.]|jgi:hypothetical protein|nr:RhuM family protein [Desulfatiglans sp.]
MIEDIKMTKDFKPIFRVTNRITAKPTRLERARGFQEVAIISKDWAQKMGRRALMLPVQGQLLLYRTEYGRTHIEVHLQEETVRMTQATMAELYQTTPQNITLHLKAIYQWGELDPQPTCKEFLQVQSEGSRRISRNRKFYKLPAIIAVGYRVRSPHGTSCFIPASSEKPWQTNWPRSNIASSISTGWPGKPAKKHRPTMPS